MIAKPRFQSLGHDVPSSPPPALPPPRIVVSANPTQLLPYSCAAVVDWSVRTAPLLLYCCGSVAGDDDDGDDDYLNTAFVSTNQSVVLTADVFQFF